MAQRTKLLTAIEVLRQRDSIAARIGFHCRTLRWPSSNTWPRSAMFTGMKAGKPLSNMSHRPARTTDRRYSPSHGRCELRKHVRKSAAACRNLAVHNHYNDHDFVTRPTEKLRPSHGSFSIVSLGSLFRMMQLLPALPGGLFFAGSGHRAAGGRRNYVVTLICGEACVSPPGGLLQWTTSCPYDAELCLAMNCGAKAGAIRLPASLWSKVGSDP